MGRLRILAAAASLAACASVSAEEWTLDSSIAARLAYNDNLRMQADDQDEDAYLSLSPALKFSSRTEARDINVGLGANINRYLDLTRNNSVDYRFDTSARWNGELDQWSLTVGSLRDSTLNSELVDTAQVLERRQRTQNSMSAAWTRAIGPDTRASLSLAGAQVRYETGTTNLVDFDDNSATLALNHSVSTRLALTGSYTYRDFQTVDNTVDIRTRAGSYLVGGSWLFNERASVGLSLGGQQTRTEQVVVYHPCLLAYLGMCLMYSPDTETLVVHTESSGLTYSGNLNYSFESSALTASFARGLTGSGSGALLRTDTLAIGYGVKFDEVLSANLGGSMTRSRNPDADTGTTRFSALSTSLNWQIERDFFLSAAVTHSTQRAPGQEKAAEGNLVMFSLNWQLQPISISR